MEKKPLISDPLWVLRNFFHEFFLNLQLEIVPSFHPMQFKGKLKNQIEKIVKNLVSGPILAYLAQIQVVNSFSQKSSFVSH